MTYIYYSIFKPKKNPLFVRTLHVAFSFNSARSGEHTIQDSHVITTMS